MILCDAGPLIALADLSDAAHARCNQAARSFAAGPLVTTLPCFVEAMHILGKRGGFLAQKQLWQMWEQEKLRIHCPSEKELGRMRELMELYSNVPMDFADASIVAAAEFLDISEIFTVDSHFYIYRLRDGSPLTVVP